MLDSGRERTRKDKAAEMIIRGESFTPEVHSQGKNEAGDGSDELTQIASAPHSNQHSSLSQHNDRRVEKGNMANNNNSQAQDEEDLSSSGEFTMYGETHTQPTEERKLSEVVPVTGQPNKRIDSDRLKVPQLSKKNRRQLEEGCKQRLPCRKESDGRDNDDGSEGEFANRRQRSKRNTRILAREGPEHNIESAGSSPKLGSADELSLDSEDGDHNEDGGMYKSVEERKKQFFTEAEAIVRDYTAACEEAKQLMEERIKEIKDAYFAEVRAANCLISLALGMELRSWYRLAG